MAQNSELYRRHREVATRILHQETGSCVFGATLKVGYNPAVLLEELLDVKAKEPRQTVCNVPKDDPKDPYCGGKLKKVTELDPDAKKAAGAGKEVFRCQVCKTLYVEDSPYAVKK